MKKSPSIVLLTGAGISAESGLATFRDSGGTWEKRRIEDVATPQAFRSNPALVLEFYNQRRRDATAAQPNAAHKALALLEKEWPGNFLLITQNVDALHEAAGSQKLLHMHGALHSALCMHCGHRSPWQGDMERFSICPQCEAEGSLRPDIVWFGETPYHMDIIEKALQQADIFAAIGTSGQVYPAAGFVYLAQHNGARTFEINLVCDLDDRACFDEALSGPATVTVPAFVARMLAEYGAECTGK